MSSGCTAYKYVKMKEEQPHEKQKRKRKTKKQNVFSRVLVGICTTTARGRMERRNGVDSMERKQSAPTPGFYKTKKQQQKEL